MKLQIATVMTTLALASPAIAQDATEFPQKVAPFKPYYMAAGEFAYVSGFCSHRMSAEAESQARGTYERTYDGVSESSETLAELRRMLRDSMDANYHAGQADPYRVSITVAGCEGMLKRSGDRLNVEASKIKAELE